MGNQSSIPELRRSRGGRHGNPLQYSCLENPHGQKNLVGYSPRGPKELGTTERLSTTWQPLNLHHLCKLASILYFLINSKLCKIISVGFSMKDYLSTVLSLKSRVVIFFSEHSFCPLSKINSHHSSFPCVWGHSSRVTDSLAGRSWQSVLP